MKGQPTAIFAKVDASALPLRVLRERGDHLEGCCDGQKVYEADVLVSDNFDLVDKSKASKLVPEGLF